MQANTLKTNSAKKIIEPKLHDANIVGILNFSSSKIGLLICCQDSKLIMFLATGVIVFHAHNYGNKNIILDATIEEGEGDYAEFLDSMKIAGYLISGEYEVYVTTGLKAGTFKAITINPSQGCLLYLICESVEISSLVGLDRLLEGL